MKKLVFALLLMCPLSMAFGQTDTLTSDKAASYVDKQVTVKGKVAGARRFDSGNERAPFLLINLDENYPNSPLTVVVYKEVLEKTTLNAEDLTGKKVVATGKISVFRGRNQLVIEKIEDLKILN
ncbi:MULTISPECIES: hypothetical protein [Emticicia]|uniref:hypothetical protein n=1 Tax=Emticicia TaxID=312278 RepID=UPI0020A11B39|nr:MULTISPECIES: hypothetical protein [Emticicia]UTA67921.1 hypothetical protein MB380_20340 [Emticicia sp. 21SJ11W-3]